MPYCFSSLCDMLNTEEIDFPFLRFLFECRVTGPLLYFTSRRGETIKGLIAREMKKLFPCPFSLSCDECNSVDDPSECVYVRFFRNNHTRKPFAYTIVPPLSNRSVYQHNEKFSFEIRLFGACASFEYVIRYLTPAIEQGGLLSGIGTWYRNEEQHFGRFQLSTIYAWQNNSWDKIFQEEEGFITKDIDIQLFAEQLSKEISVYNRLLFYTPFCLKKSGKVINEPGLEDFVYFSIMRLRTITGDRTIKIDDNIYERSGAVKPIRSQFEQTISAKNMRYYVGGMEFEQLPKEVVPFLMLGGFCHIGKSASQGYGGFFVIPN